MRLITFALMGRERLGAWVDGDREVIDLTAMAAADPVLPAGCCESMLALIDAGPSAWAAVRARVDSGTGPRLATDSISLLAPLPRPRQFRDFIGFAEHLVNSFRAAKGVRLAQASNDAERALIEASNAFDIPAIWYQSPIYYTASHMCVSGPGAEITWPSYSRIMDYELEFAAVIGTPGRDITATGALDHVFGFTIFNDLSARDEQMRVMEGKLGPGKGKEFDGSNILGPCIVTMDEIGDPYALEMTARINGEEVSRGNSGTMHHRFEDMISFAARGQTIHAGEVFGSGTVGTGCGLEHGRMLKDGDVIELHVEKIGTLRNRIRAPGP
jgi:2-keto-4-pentenoate hydratase/2-oxohepta-3-ene-1,7-dioic acid hydratase in catechol pathway